MSTKESKKSTKRVAGAASRTLLQFHQLDIDFDEHRIRCSTWGSVRLRFIGRDEILYFNLSVGGQWAVQNIPVLSREGAGKKQETWFSFPLGNREGERVRRVEYGYALTRRP